MSAIITRNLRIQALLLTMLACPAWVSAADKPGASQPIENIVVTGTRIQEATPVNVITMDRAFIDRSGHVTLTGLVRDLVYNSAGTVDEQFTQGFAPASAAIDLRGMGVSRTLVLLDGRRMPIFPFAMNGSESFVDINLIPLAAVERVEVLKDGASAIYGADAIAGVVNIITRDANSPRRISGRYSSTSEGDGDEAQISLNGGATVGDAELSFAMDYVNRDHIMARDRNISESANGPIDDRSNAGNPGTFITSLGPVPDSRCPADSVRGPFCTYDFAKDVTLVPETERIGILGSWDQSLTDTVGAFTRVMYNHSESSRDLAGAPNAYPVSAANPNNPFGEDVLAIYRLKELGPRRDDFDSDSYNWISGLNGTISGWNWELAGGRSEVDTTIKGVLGYALNADVQSAIDAGTLNVFGDSPNLDPNDLLYRTKRKGKSYLTQFDFNVAGNLFDMPHGPAGAAFGIEYRDENFSDKFDPATAAGDVIGVGGVSATGDRDVWAMYAEFVFPLLDSVELQLAGRYDDYSDFGNTFNPKLGLNWQARDDLLLHATVSTGFKAPALHELYSGEIVGFNSVFDTTNCNAARAANNAADIATYCDNVQEAMFISSGNEDLDAEESDNLSLGAAWSATEDWDVNVDWWHIKNDDAVASNPQFYIDNESEYPGNVVRDPGGDIAMVLSPFRNVAEQKIWGIDMSTELRFDVGAVGDFKTGLTTTYLGSFEQKASAGQPTEDIAGEDGYAEWRAQADLTWIRADYQASVTVNYIDGYDREDADDSIDSWTSVDMQLNWNPALLRGGAVALGMDNVFDEEPPEDPFLEGWPFFNRALHDPRGRSFYLRYSQDF